MVGDPTDPVNRLPPYRPQLATLVKAPPEGPAWIHEVKYDGFRIGATLARGKVRLLSRNGQDWTARFSAIAGELSSLATTALLDGEVAAVLSDGRTSFQTLQQGARQGSADIVYFVFDLLYANGHDLRHLPLKSRKVALEALLRGHATGAIRLGGLVESAGEDVLERACELGFEGVISKRSDQPYRAGRSDDWVKTKCQARQEFVIGGYTEPTGRRPGIGALLLGHHRPDGALVYAGKVGTGFSDDVARSLRKRLDALERADSPFTGRPPLRGRRQVHWATPTLVADIAFTEWTADGRVRHPSFQGLRDDKAATAVRRERPRVASPPTSADQVAGIRISHPTRVVFDDARRSKLDLARYYEAMAERIVPHLRGRPLTLVRCPDGAGGACFFMKHARARGLAPLRRVSIREKKKVGEYLIADDLPGLIGLVQMNVLEIHTWNATDANLEHPDCLVLDLDPGPRVTWKQTVEAARLVRTVLDSIALRSFVKTTGGEGLHVVVPLEPSADWALCLRASRAVAETLERHAPARYTTAFAKAGRDDKVLVDYLRNNRANTSVAAYSTRARPHGPVSMPIAWAELSTRTAPERFTLVTVPKRIATRPDPWADYWTVRQRLTPAIVKALEDV